MAGQPVSGTRVCRSCGTEQPISEYYTRSDGKPDLHCKNCVGARSRTHGARARREKGIPERWRPVERTIDGQVERLCRSCRLFKPADEFYEARASGWAGLAAICKSCTVDLRIQRYDATLDGRPKRKQTRNRAVVVIDGVESILCVRCDRPRPLTEFYRYKNGKPLSNCIACTLVRSAEADRSWRQTDEYRARERERLAQERAEDPERFRGYSRQRAMRKRGVSSDLTDDEWLAIWTAYDGLCAYCGDPATSQDHLLPIVRGGAHTAVNVVPACKSCNSRKRTRTPEEWAARGGRSLDLGPHPFI